MALKQQLEEELKTAMRGKDELGKRVIRSIMTNIKLAEVEKGGPLDEASLLALVQKELKVRDEAIEGAEKASRDDLVKENQAEKVFLERFLPKQLSQDELIELARNVIVEVHASQLSDMGKIMKIIIPRVAGRAPNAQVSQVVKELLQQ